MDEATLTSSRSKRPGASSLQHVGNASVPPMNASLLTVGEGSADSPVPTTRIDDDTTTEIHSASITPTRKRRHWQRVVLSSSLLTAAATLYYQHGNTTQHTRRLQRASSSCDSHAWHVSTAPSRTDTCTNSLSYPAEWDRDDLRPLVLFASKKKCCKALEERMPGVQCKSVDVCREGDRTTSTTTAATTTTTTTDTSIFYPVPQSVLCLATSPHNIDTHPQFHFSTPEQCCSSGWMDYNTCILRTIQHIYAVPPTAPPSSAPNTDYPTWSPTLYDCSAVHATWHMSTTQLFTCTNDNHDELYPREWTLYPHLHLFSSPQECCRGKFPGLACRKVDVCDPTRPPTGMPTPKPTVHPTKLPTVHPTRSTSPSEAPTSITTNNNQWGWCSSNPWHLSSKYKNTCTNDDEYPTSWNHDTLSKYFLSDSVLGCCQMNYFGRPGEECLIHDICLDDEETNESTIQSTMLPTKDPSTTPRPTIKPSLHPITPTNDTPPVDINPSASSQPTSNPTKSSPNQTNSSSNQTQNCGPWHPATGNQACSNGKNDYPKAWDSLPEQMKDAMFYDSAEDCCQKYWKGDCDHIDYCEGETSSSTTTTTMSSQQQVSQDCDSHEFWHPVTTTGTPGSCSNGLNDYPKAWDTLISQQQAEVFFDSAENCCQRYWKMECNQINVCAGSTANGGDSIPNKPTNEPTTQKKPDNVSSSVEIQHDCGMWHPVTDQEGKICSNGKDNYPQSWNTLPASQMGNLFFPSDVDCCINYWKGECEIDDQCEDEDTSPGGESDPVDDGSNNEGGSEPEWDTSNCGRWHPTAEKGECSNGKDDYNPVWDMLPDSQKDLLFFDDADACCKSYWGDRCFSIADQCKPPGPTQKPTNKPIIVNDGEIAITFGTDNFDNPASSFPWNIGDPPEWEITTLGSDSGNAMVSVPVAADDPSKKKTSTIALKTSFDRDARFRCNAKVDTMMPFDWFSLRINGAVEYPYYATSSGKWISFGGKLDAGENLIEMVVEAGPTSPSVSRNSGLGYGSGYVWLDECSLKED